LGVEIRFAADKEANKEISRHKSLGLSSFDPNSKHVGRVSEHGSI